MMKYVEMGMKVVATAALVVIAVELWKGNTRKHTVKVWGDVTVQQEMNEQWKVTSGY